MEGSYDERLKQLGLDATQLAVDDDGTIGAPLSASSSELLASLPRMLVASGDPGESLPGIAPAFRLGDSLGEGGMGVVRTAYDSAIGRQVAVKLLPRGQPESAAVELLREARIGGGLEHPNILPVYALGRDHDDRLLMVMKRIEGTPWCDWMTAGEDADWPIVSDDPLSFHLDMLMQVSNAVHFAHARGIIHRDLKPANVMIGSFGEVYLLDWGISVSMRRDDELLPYAGDVDHIAGTPPYMAPELVAAYGDLIGPRTDVYLLGAILHEILTGEPPHRGDTVPEVLSAAFESAPPSFEDWVPWELAAVCRRALSRHPENRHPDAFSFRQAIHGYLVHRGSAQLERQASAKLIELEPLLEGRSDEQGQQAIRHLATEARFGYRLALEAWPDNSRARQQRERFVRRMIDYHVAGERRDEAAALLEDLPGDHPDLRQKLAQLDEHLAAKEAELGRLRRLAHDADVTVQAGERVRIALVLAVVVGLIGVGLMAAAPEQVEMDYPRLLGGLGALLLVVGIGWLRLRRSNEVNRRFVGAMAVTVAATGVHLTVAMLTGLPVSCGIRQMVFLIALGALVAAITLHRGLVLAAAVYGVAFVAMAVFPAVEHIIFVTSHVLGFVAMAWAWQRATMAVRGSAETGADPGGKAGG